MKPSEEDIKNALIAKQQFEDLPDWIKEKVPVFSTSVERLLFEIEDGEVSVQTLHDCNEGMQEVIKLMSKDGL